MNSILPLKKICIILLVTLACLKTTAQLSISLALCENKEHPLGVYLNNIHFSWQLQSKQFAQVQTAYQIVIATSKSNLESDVYDVWNSSVIKSSVSQMINYTGKKLSPAKIYYWRVKAWDKYNKPSAWSDVQQFTTGIFSKQDWANAKWIGYEELPDSMKVIPGVHAPQANELGNKCMQRPITPWLRKEFPVTKKINNALLFITGLGQYEVNINGIKVGNTFLAPGWTYFEKTVLYNVYDVSNQLQKGNNAIGAVVGNGFYNINRERYFKIVSAFGMPKLICCLKISYDDGSIDNIISDDSWKTAPSATTFNSIYGGEDFDAQLEQPGWDRAGFNSSAWKPALVVNAPGGKLLPEQDYPLQLLDTFKSKKIQQTAPGVYLYDFGQNISGIVKLKIKGRKGQQVKLVPSELITTNNLPNQQASGDPFYFSYTLKGDEEEVWQPQFSYYGFRYVQVIGAVPDTAVNNHGLPVIEQLTSLHNRNSNPSNGSFTCSNELFNRIYTLINWAIKCNMQSVVTDCPHREKLSWLEQDYLMGASIHYNFDVYHLYRKLVLDLIDAQNTNGLVPDIAPEYVVFYDGFVDSPEWGSSAVILPWLLYSWYGDKEILQQAYPMMKRYVAYLERKSTKQILSHGLGDWFDYGPNDPGEAQLTPKALTATAIYYYDVMLLGKIASVLNYKKDEAAINAQAKSIYHAFNRQFFNASAKVYSTGSQTAMAMPLCVGLVDEQNKKQVLQNLIDSIYAGNKALTAGDIGFHFLVKTLDDGGASQLIYDMNNRDDVPGYGFQLKKGATALTESWPALKEVSNNHLMLGHIMEWFYSGLAGIGQEENSIGFKNIKIRPQPVGDITSASGSFHSPYGWINTNWKKDGDHFLLKVNIPVNSIATVYVPVTSASKIYLNGKIVAHPKKIKNNTAIVEIGSGEYQFEVK